jgi:hypothetical protein
MRLRSSLSLLAVTLTTVGAGLAAAPPALAACSITDTSGCATTQQTTVTGVIGSGGLGVRTLAAVPVTTLVPGTGSTMTAPLAVTAIEVGAQGDNAWHVTAVAGDLSDTANDTISASHMSVADTAIPTTGGCLALSACTATGGGATPRALDTAATLFSVTGESAGAIYTGAYVYTGQLSLDVPNGTPTGAYTGQLTVTLVQ